MGRESGIYWKKRTAYLYMISNENTKKENDD
jgi:hypothetical protein